MPDPDSYHLKAGASSARFFARGAECRQWRVGARELLWPGDQSIWPAVAPVLFPTCGWSRDGAIRVEGASYPMAVHGFASQSEFRGEQTSEQSVTFTLSDDAETRASYPFAFNLAVTYSLTPDALQAEIAVSNTGVVAMPYACGLHPGIVWGEGAYRFRFAKPERPDVPVIAPGGLFSQRRRPVPLAGDVLPLAKPLFAAEALCFVDARSRSFAFEGPDGALEIDAPDFPHLVLWNSAGAPFLAIESWTGTGDLEGFSGELSERPSMIHLAPGARRTHGVSYRWRDELGAARFSP